MGDVPLIDADRFLQCGRPANIPEADLRERLLLAVAARRAQGLANEGFAADVSSPAYGADFLLRAAKARGRNLRSPRITYTT
jgi:2-keto-4-pentenoate hydratase